MVSTSVNINVNAGINEETLLSVCYFFIILLSKISYLTISLSASQSSPLKTFQVVWWVVIDHPLCAEHCAQCQGYKGKNARVLWRSLEAFNRWPMTHTKECRGNINSPYAAKDHTCQRESMGERGITEYVISKLLLGHFHFIYKVCVCVCVWLHLEACRFSSLMRDQTPAPWSGHPES